MPVSRNIQIVRGAAITAVVCIHCLPQFNESFLLRPFLNWG